MLRVMEGEICKALRIVQENVATAAARRTKDFQHLPKPRLVAVTKTKPLSMVKEAYKCGQIHFGENYVQELEEKAKDVSLVESCPDIRWHFIGHLQGNKVRKVLGVSNLFMLETVENIKLATTVDKTWEKLERPFKLKIMVQVNTSGEENKHGCHPNEVCSIVEHVRDRCDHLEFIGLMTIGAFDHSYADGPNPDFEELIRCKENVCKQFALDPINVELSMGMSNDYEHAIAVGSTNVRVGSTIFGARSYSAKPSPSPESSPSPAAGGDGGAAVAVNEVSNKLDEISVKDK